MKFTDNVVILKPRPPQDSATELNVAICSNCPYKRAAIALGRVADILIEDEDLIS